MLPSLGRNSFATLPRGLHRQYPAETPCLVTPGSTKGDNSAASRRKGVVVDASRAIGARIREARRAVGLTQEQLAELSGTSTRTVRDIEKGTGATGLGIVARVADVVGLRLTVDG